MDDFEKELKFGFLDEASQALSDVEQCFLSLESNPNDPDNLNKIFRLAHNLKGSSKAVGFDEMGSFTHEFETFILKIKNQELNPTPEIVSLLLRSNDHLKMMVDSLKSNLEAKFDSKSLLDEMASAMSGSSNSTPELVESLDSESGQGSEPENFEELISQEPPSEEFILAQSEPIQESIVKNSKSLPEAAPQAEAKQTKPHESPNKSQTTQEENIRVSLNKVESLINSIGEMVILQSVMREQVNQSDSLVLKKTSHQLGKIGKEIQDLAMSLRMVPIKPTFQKMQRIVRDTAQALKKDVGIKLLGEDTELDKTVLEKINDPLVHLIRNSVDHGIEDAQKRIQNGKSSKGNIVLSATQKSGKLYIEVIDDGGGIDPAKIRAKAIEKGIISSESKLTEKECIHLIFAAGFSTKEQVTDVSGRGVGMDVVKTNIQELGGEIQIDSEVGKGSTFRIILPLTLAIIDGLVVISGSEKYVLPLNHIHETLQPTDKQIQFTTGLGDVLMLRGENLPIFQLGDFFGKHSNHLGHELIALVVRTGQTPFALMVDDIVGQFQVVIKQLGPELQGFKGISGSTILGDGKPALIIEPLDLIKRQRVVKPGTSLTQLNEINLTKNTNPSTGGKAA